ncbi:MAG TPA: tetratricopeptide repeat protein [Gammaproteobacteria bacterium]|nr:tetratricopeptide repeat protein [Gammaproteobacteria bacterium]
MSTRFAEHRQLARALGAALLALDLAACGSSTPRQAEVKPAPTVVAPAPEKTVSAAPAAKAAEPSRKDKRRGRDEPDPAAAVAAADAIPEAAAVAYDRALAAMRAQNWVQAELELEQLARDYPAYPGPLVNLAIAYKRDGRADDAAAAIERALAADPDNAAANTERGIMLREQGKFAEAEAAYRRALAADPQHALAHYNLGVLLDVYLRRPGEALEHYQAYQASLSEPDSNVAKWIVDLKRRAGNNDKATVAQGDSP